MPTTWSESQPSIRRHPPQLGEHSVEVLREAGLSDEQIARLVERGVTLQFEQPGQIGA